MVKSQKKPARGGEVEKVRKGYYLPVDVVRDYEHLSVDLARPACDLVETAMRAGLEKLRSGRQR